MLMGTRYVQSNAVEPALKTVCELISLFDLSWIMAFLPRKSITMAVTKQCLSFNQVFLY